MAHSAPLADLDTRAGCIDISLYEQPLYLVGRSCLGSALSPHCDAAPCAAGAAGSGPGISAWRRTLDPACCGQCAGSLCPHPAYGGPLRLPVHGNRYLRHPRQDHAASGLFCLSPRTGRSSDYSPNPPHSDSPGREVGCALDVWRAVRQQSRKTLALAAQAVLTAAFALFMLIRYAAGPYDVRGLDALAQELNGRAQPADGVIPILPQSYLAWIDQYDSSVHDTGMMMEDPLSDQIGRAS